jgi:hypothetical protein
MVFAFIYTKKKEAETKGHKEAEKVLLEMEYPWRKLSYASSGRTRQTLWGRCTDATPKLSTNDT